MKVNISKSVRVTVTAKYQSFVFESGLSTDVDIEVPPEEFQDTIPDVGILHLETFQDRVHAAGSIIQTMCLNEVFGDIDNLAQRDPDFAVIVQTRKSELETQRRVLERQGK